MISEPKRLKHPLAAYLIGLIFSLISLAVMVGVMYHFAFSHHGPAILAPLEQKIMKHEKSEILEEVKRHEAYEVHRHFHHTEEYPSLPEGSRPACYICHSDFPHTKNKKVRALLNMHTQFFVCETCHIKDIEGMSIVYSWYNPLSPDPAGPFIGQYYDVESGNLVEPEDQLTKIAPFFESGEKRISVIVLQDTVLAQDYIRVRDKLTPEQRDNFKNKFHSNLKVNEVDTCKSCHSAKGVMNFSELGFSDDRRQDLEQLNIAGMITKYEKFYIPKLFTK